jgi:hypothetical protein
LAETPSLSAEIKNWLVPRVIELADQVVTRDPAKWPEYCAPPLKLAPTPDAITAEALSDCIPVYLDYLIEQQSPDGNWEPTWSWFGNFPEQWDQAKLEWQGVLTWKHF